MNAAHASNPSHTAVRILAIAIALVTTFVGLTPAATAAPGDDVTVTAPSRITKGASFTITVTTGDSWDGTATLWARTDDVWRKSAVKPVITDGTGTATWTATSSRSYYVQLEGAGKSPVYNLVVEDSNRYAVSSKLSAPEAATGEMVWAHGYAYLKGKALSKPTLVLERKKNGGTSWSTVTTATAKTTGYYSFRFSPSTSYAYRVRVGGESAISTPLIITRTSADRTLEYRADQLAWKIGDAAGGVVDIPSDNLPSGVSSARAQTFENGRLYEVTRSGTVRTWLVYDRIGDKFAALGRSGGKLGLPMRDSKCGLLEKGCVQRFTGGSIYVNGASMSPGAYVGYGSVVETEILAAAWSQVGYEEPSWRVNKYTKWLGSKPAWCMTFTAWAAAASGNGSMVPNSSTYAKYVSTLEASGRLHKSGTPPVGSALLLDWNNGTPSHSALLVKISGKYIYTLEGNTTDGSGDPQRGVYYRQRLLSDIWAWYTPSDT